MFKARRRRRFFRRTYNPPFETPKSGRRGGLSELGDKHENAFVLAHFTRQTYFFKMSQNSSTFFFNKFLMT